MLSAKDGSLTLPKFGAGRTGLCKSGTWRTTCVLTAEFRRKRSWCARFRDESRIDRTSAPSLILSGAFTGHRVRSQRLWVRERAAMARKPQSAMKGIVTKPNSSTQMKLQGMVAEQKSEPAKLGICSMA